MVICYGSSREKNVLLFWSPVIVGVGLRGEGSGDTQEESSEEAGLVDGVGLGWGNGKGRHLSVCSLGFLRRRTKVGWWWKQGVGERPQNRCGQGRVERVEGHVRDR